MVDTLLFAEAMVGHASPSSIHVSLTNAPQVYS